MRTKFVAVAMTALCLATAASAAFAETVTLKFTGSTGAAENIGHGESVYVYPYDFTINGTTNTTLMCISYDDHITNNESWTATVTQLSSSSSSFDKEEAYLFSLITPSTSSTTEAYIQFADWYLSDRNAVDTTTFYLQNTSAIMGYVNAATSTGLDQSNAFYSGFDLYTPAGSSSYYDARNGYPDGMPQSFIGDPMHSPTPEPGSLALLGTGIVGMGGVLRRRFRKV